MAICLANVWNWIWVCDQHVGNKNWVSVARCEFFSLDCMLSSILYGDQNWKCVSGLSWFLLNFGCNDSILAMILNWIRVGCDNVGKTDGFCVTLSIFNTVNAHFVVYLLFLPWMNESYWSSKRRPGNNIWRFYNLYFNLYFFRVCHLPPALPFCINFPCYLLFLSRVFLHSLRLLQYFLLKDSTRRWSLIW